MNSRSLSCNKHTDTKSDVLFFNAPFPLLKLATIVDTRDKLPVRRNLFRASNSERTIVITSTTTFLSKEIIWFAYWYVMPMNPLAGLPISPWQNLRMSFPRMFTGTRAIRKMAERSLEVCEARFHGTIGETVSAAGWARVGSGRWTRLVYHLPADKSVRAECFAVPHRVRTVHKQRGFPGVRLSSHVPGVHYLNRPSRAVE